MKTINKNIRIIVPIFLIFTFLGCNHSKPNHLDHLTQEIETIRQLDIAWSKTGETKDLKAQLEIYSDDQSPLILPPHCPMIKGKENIRAFLEPIYRRPDFSVTWKPLIIEIAQSGDLAYVVGKVNSSLNDSEGNPVPDQGKYIEIWKKQKNGNWKVVADIFNSDLSLSNSTETK